MLDRPAATMPATVPLNKLKFGDDKPGGGVNARTSDRREGLDELGASLLAHGIIQPLTVEAWGKGDYYVIDGNRRLAALRKLVNDKRLAKDHPIKVAALDPGTDAIEASLAANILRLPMHEVDQYEAFAKLAERGQDAAEIASHFGATELTVRRRLALGKLSPTIRTAWREGKIPVDAAQAFTLVEDQELQDRTYQSLAKGRNLYRHAVIRALTGDEQSWQSRRFLALVGKKALVAAGGRVVEDLFEPDDPKILDQDLLQRLVRERVEAECARLVAGGWAWAAWDRDLPVTHGSWKRDRMDEVVFGDEGSEERATFTQLRADLQNAETLTGGTGSNERWKAHDAFNAFLDLPASLRMTPLITKIGSGCKLAIDGDGKLRVAGRYLRPGDVPAEQTEAETPAPAVGTPTAGGISAALSQTLSEQRTIAVAGALSSDPALALRLLVATLQSQRSPARITARGYAGLTGLEGIGSLTWAHAGAAGPSFEEAFVLTERSTTAALLTELAGLVAASIDLTDAARDNAGMAVTGQDDLVDALDPDVFLEEARQVFDPENYFDRIPAKAIVAAIVEMRGENTCIGTKKPDLVLHAAAAARDTGWLPEQLRCAGYRIATPKPAAAGTTG